MRSFCLVPSYDLPITNEGDLCREDLLELSSRVARLEEHNRQRLVCILEPKELYAASIDYTNDVRRQWEELKRVLVEHPVTAKGLIISARVMNENAMRLGYRGIRCEYIPYTHCTKMVFVGKVLTTNYLLDVD